MIRMKASLPTFVFVLHTGTMTRACLEGGIWSDTVDRTNCVSENLQQITQQVNLLTHVHYVSKSTFQHMQ